MRRLRHWVLPLLGAACYGVAGMLSLPALRLYVADEPRPGRVTGMLLIRPEGIDYADRAEMEFDFRTADGESHRVRVVDGRIARPGVGALSEAAGSDVAPARALERLDRIAMEMRTAGVGELSWLLQRENRNPDPARLVAIAKEERYRVFHGLRGMPGAFDTDGVPDSLQGGSGPGVDITRVELGFRNPGARAKPELLRFDRWQDGVVQSGGRQDFLLHRETWRTEFRPVVTDREGAGQGFAVTDIGRRGKPAAGFTLFSEARVYGTGRMPQGIVDPRAPGSGVGMSAAQAFSRLCECFFARWAYPLMLVLLGSGLWIAAALVASFGWFPSRCRGDWIDGQ